MINIDGQLTFILTQPYADSGLCSALDHLDSAFQFTRPVPD